MLDTVLTIQVSSYFKTDLFNGIFEEYRASILESLLYQFLLKSAKGGSGKGFESKPQLFDKIVNASDMPYYVHIINGLFPAALLLERYLFESKLLDQPQTDLYVKLFWIGFTLHDLNKLYDQDLSLEENVDHHLREICLTLAVEKFLPDYRKYLDEIRFSILRTENRTSISAYDKPFENIRFFEEVLGKYSHLADSLASIDNFANIQDFYTRVRKYLPDMNFSFVEITPNPKTLLAQKLKHICQEIIRDREETIFFNLRNGFVWEGEPLDGKDLEAIKNKFSNLSDDIDVVGLTKIDHQSCDFGFKENMRLSQETIIDVIEHKYPELLKVVKDISAGENPELVFLLKEILEEHIASIYSLAQKKNKRGELLNEFWIKVKEEWADLDKEEKQFLTLTSLFKIKFLNIKHNKVWKAEYDEFLTNNDLVFLNQDIEFDSEDQTKRLSSEEMLTLLSKSKSKATLISILKAYAVIEQNEYVEGEIDKQAQEIINHFANFLKPINKTEFDQFIDLYLTGNYVKALSRFEINRIPVKTEMCIYCGKEKSLEYDDSKTFSITALNFSNRSNNTLKSKRHYICTLCNAEATLRKTLAQHSAFKESKQNKNNSIVYYDFGNYLFNIETGDLLNVLKKIGHIDFERYSKKHSTRLKIEKATFDYNLYHTNFDGIAKSVEGNFYYVFNKLKLILKTGFKVSTASILSPYTLSNEIFVFENCLPFVKQLGWNRVRIDQIETVLEEMKFFFSLGKNRLTANILEYAKERRAIFTIFYRLDEQNKQKTINGLIKIIQHNPEVFDMTVMEELAQFAIQIDLGFGSTAQETWMIRESIDILKDCYKESQDPETTKQQIAGHLYKKIKGKDQKLSPEVLTNFADALYEKLFVKAWKENFPQPNRLKNWIYQFAFLYYQKSLDEIRRRTVRKARNDLAKKNQEITEQSILKELAKDEKKKKYIEQYRPFIREILAEENAS